MRNFAMFCFAVVVSLSIGRQVVAQGTRSTEERVVRLESQLLEAQRTCNADVLTRLLADNFVITSNREKLTSKADVIVACKNAKWTLIRVSDLNLSVFGDTVITTGDFRGDGTDSLGRPLEVHERWTRTWVKMPSGQWQCVASHMSSAAM